VKEDGSEDDDGSEEGVLYSLQICFILYCSPTRALSTLSVSQEQSNSRIGRTTLQALAMNDLITRQMKTRRYNGTGSARSAIVGLLYTLLHTTLYLALRALQRQLTIFNGGIASIGRAVNNLLPRRSVSSMICRRHGAGKSEFTIQPLTIQDGRHPTSNGLYVAAFHYVRHRQHTTTDS